MKSSASISAALLVLLVSCASTHTHTPTTLVQTFCREYPHRLSGGLPRGADMRWLRPRISDRLHRAFLDTIAYQDDWIRRNPDRPPHYLKPPFADGVHFDGVPDGHTSSEVVGEVQQGNGTWDVRVHFRYDQAPGWEAVAIVKSERGRLVIDDIRYDDGVLLSQILASRDE